MRRSFTVAQKLKLLNECENYSYKEIAIKHSIHLSMLYKWQLVKDKLLTTNKRTRSIGSGRKAMHPEKEEELFNKLKEWRKEGVPVAYSHLIVEMRELVENETFKASYGWIRGFKKRYNLTLRTPTDKKQYGKVIDMEVVRNYLNYLKEKESLNQYTTIVNMDETPTWFNQPIKKTVDFIGAKEVPLTHNDPNNRRRITTILAATEKGKMLDPCVIYKSESKQAKENPGSTAHYVEGVRCYKQPNNTMTSSIMVDYIKNFLVKEIPSGKTLLIMDSFLGHKTAEVKKTCKENNIDIMMIPGGYTGLLQPLDISVNRSFKSKLKFIKFKGSNSKERLLDLIKNVKSTALEVSPECIMNGFRKMREIEN
jgi:hypothetical protein